MGLRNISLKRRPTSYGKVQRAIGNAIRNRERLLSRDRLQKSYVDLGCGPNIHPGFVSVDYVWRPGLDVCWDISKGIPMPDNSVKGVFSEHCLEHFPIETADFVLSECKRILTPGGTVRLVVPDAELYLRLYIERMNGSSREPFPYEGDQAFKGQFTPLLSVNSVYYVDRESPAGHRCMFDFALLSQLLESNGFTEIARRAYMEGRDTHLLIDSPARECESLYVEAIA